MSKANLLHGHFPLVTPDPLKHCPAPARAVSAGCQKHSALHRPSLALLGWSSAGPQAVWTRIHKQQQQQQPAKQQAASGKQDSRSPLMGTDSASLPACSGRALQPQQGTALARTDQPQPKPLCFYYNPVPAHLKGVFNRNPKHDQTGRRAGGSPGSLSPMGPRTRQGH